MHFSGPALRSNKNPESTAKNNSSHLTPPPENSVLNPNEILGDSDYFIKHFICPLYDIKTVLNVLFWVGKKTAHIKKNVHLHASWPYWETNDKHPRNSD